MRDMTNNPYYELAIRVCRIDDTDCIENCIAAFEALERAQVEENPGASAQTVAH